MNKIIIIRITFNNLKHCNAWRKETKLAIQMRPLLSRTWMRRKELKTSSSFASKMGSRISWTLKTKRRERTKVVNKVFKRIIRIINCKRSTSKWELKLKDRTKTVISLPIRPCKRTQEANFKAKTIALITRAYSKGPTTPVVASTVAINSMDLWTSAILHPNRTLTLTLTPTSKTPTRATTLMAPMDPKSLRQPKKTAKTTNKTPKPNLNCGLIILIKKSNRRKVFRLKIKGLTIKTLRICKTRTNLA